MTTREYPTLGCCGIDCGLCPRHYTDGSSRCPGCGGEGFAQVHPPCGFISCNEKHGVQVCGQCAEFPCKRFARETGEHDSFVLHRRVMPNQRAIQCGGLQAFLTGQAERIAFLQTALQRFDDGRSKGFFCVAATLISLEGLQAALREAEQGGSLRAALMRIADAEGQELKLRK
jgi:hypothetical protein